MKFKIGDPVRIKDYAKEIHGDDEWSDIPDDVMGKVGIITACDKEGLPYSVKVQSMKSGTIIRCFHEDELEPIGDEPILPDLTNISTDILLKEIWRRIS